MSNYRIKIESDSDCMNPREDYDNLGIMACWHRNYNLGDEQPKCEPSEYREENCPDGTIVLPLYLYDHSGITMSTGSFSCNWDSGQVGIIYITPENIIKEYGNDSEASRKMATSVMESEVKLYDHHLTGNVWGYVVEKLPACDSCGHVEPEEIDSCWGFLGDDKDVVEAMMDHIENEHHHLLDQAWEDRK